MKTVIHAAAREDILRQYRWYLLEKDLPATALRFLDAVEKALGDLQRNPGLGSPRLFPNPQLAGLRSWPVAGFPSLRIYYIGKRDALRIVRILHGKRDIAAMLEEPFENR
jgi:toxin ParE1/3/4